MKKIFIENSTSWKLPESKLQIKKNIQKVVDYVSQFSSYEMSLLIVNDSQIQIYNSEKRKKNKPTDVLSFPIVE
ncbi:MAG: rRNA maturation RNase YbeY, partial [Candidatus Pacearchaeota archaeon]